MLANERRVAAATHNQALSALLFLYREVLGMDLPWLDGVQRPRTPKRIPSVLAVAEVATVLASKLVLALREKDERFVCHSYWPTSWVQGDPGQFYKHLQRLFSSGSFAGITSV